MKLGTMSGSASWGTEGGGDGRRAGGWTGAGMDGGQWGRTEAGGWTEGGATDGVGGDGRRAGRWTEAGHPTQ